MARARTVTLLSLDRWAEILGMDPRHFNQVTTAAKIVGTCSNVWKQYAWQETGQVGREDVAIAIQQAERMVSDYAGYDLLPNWRSDERVRVTQPAIPEILNIGGVDPRGFPMAFKTAKARIVSGGIEGRTLMEAGAAVAYTDLDGDTYPETATITVNTTDALGHVVTDPDEIAVYFPGESGRDEWEIKPLNDPFTRRRAVSIAGVTATIVAAREQFVDPGLWDALSPGPVAGDIGFDANFLATADVYRRWNDPQQQATLMWAPRGVTCDCATTTCATCAHSTQTGCLVAKDYRIGEFFFRPATWDSDDEAFDAADFAVGRNPDNVRIWYYAGLRDMARDAPNIEMDPSWARAVTYLSLTLLHRPLCGCNNIEGLARVMTEDLALQQSAGAHNVSYQLAERVLNNPWGTTRGALLAWNLANGEGAKIGQAVRL